MGNRNAQTFQLTNYLPLNISFQVYILYLTKKIFSKLNFFKFDIDCEISCFKFSTTSGTLQPNESRLIQVFFEPQHPIIYYKKIACLIQNHVT
jgi:hypothetical protein